MMRDMVEDYYFGLDDFALSSPASEGIIDFYKGEKFKVIIEGGTEELLERKLDA